MRCRTRRWSAICAVAALASAALAGCATVNTPLAGNSDTINFAFFGSNSEEQALQGIINLFNKTHTGQVVPIWIQADYEQKLMTTIVAGESPEVIEMPDGDVPQFQQALQPVTVDASKYSSQHVVEAYQWDGRQYAYPMSVKPYVLAENVSLFKKAGVPLLPADSHASISQFTSTAEKLKASGQRFGVLGTWLDPVVSAFGGSFFNGAGDSCELDNQQNVAAINWYINATTAADFAPNAIESASLSAPAEFASGQVPMIILGGWDLININVPHGPDWTLAPWMGLGAGVENDGLAIAKTASGSKLALARQFADFTSTDPAAQQLLANATDFQGVPVTTAAADKFVHDFPASRNIEAFVYAADHDPASAKSAKVTEALAAWEAGVDNLTKAGTGDESPAVAVKQINASCNKIMTNE